MKKIPVFFGIFIIVSIIISIVYFNQDSQFEVSTFKKLEVYSFEEKIKFNKTVEIKAANDDFIERTYVKRGDFVHKGSILMNFESDEEEFLLSKARNEYAMAVLNSGSAIQDEKKKAIALAEKKLSNTKVISPVDGYIVGMKARENLFTEKGTTLFSLIEADSEMYLVYTQNDRNFIQRAEYLSLEIKPENIKMMINPDDIKEQQSDLLIKIPLKLEEINSANLDFLYGKVQISYHSDDLAWIPIEYLIDSTVRLADGTLITVEIIERKDDLILVSGLKSGEILTILR